MLECISKKNYFTVEISFEKKKNQEEKNISRFQPSSFLEYVLYLFTS